MNDPFEPALATLLADRPDAFRTLAVRGDGFDFAHPDAPLGPGYFIERLAVAYIADHLRTEYGNGRTLGN